MSSKDHHLLFSPSRRQVARVATALLKVETETAQDCGATSKEAVLCRKDGDEAADLELKATVDQVGSRFATLSNGSDRSEIEEAKASTGLLGPTTGTKTPHRTGDERSVRFAMDQKPAFEELCTPTKTPSSMCGYVRPNLTPYRPGTVVLEPRQVNASLREGEKRSLSRFKAAAVSTVPPATGTPFPANEELSVLQAEQLALANRGPKMGIFAGLVRAAQTTSMITTTAVSLSNAGPVRLENTGTTRPFCKGDGLRKPGGLSDEDGPQI